MRKLNENDMNRIIISIGDKVIKEHNLDYNVIPITYSEFRKITISKQGNTEETNRILNRIKGIKAFTDNGNKWVIVFTNEFKNYATKEEQVFQLLLTCFHELRHCIQSKFDPFGYDKFLTEIELEYRKIDLDDYYEKHDLYSFEIGANLYAAYETRKHLMKRTPSIYEMYKDKLDAFEDTFIGEYYTYDPLRVLLPLLDNMIEKKKRLDIPVFKMFYDEECNLKPLEEIEKSEDYDKVDKSVIYYMIYAHYFKHTATHKPSERELNLLEEANDFIEKVSNNRVDSIIKQLDKKIEKKL